MNEISPFSNYIVFFAVLPDAAKYQHLYAVTANLTFTTQLVIDYAILLGNMVCPTFGPLITFNHCQEDSVRLLLTKNHASTPAPAIALGVRSTGPSHVADSSLAFF